ADIEYGLKIAKEIARMDIGQTLAVKDKMILAIEAIEGTDEAIKRAVRLARGPVTVIKIARSNHDQRFDIPTVGMNTLEAMT
ncbi:LpxI family protein, partial [Acinetobacter baumannii]